MRTYSPTACALAASLAVAACKSSTDSAPPSGPCGVPHDTSATTQTLVAGDTTFAVAFYPPALAAEGEGDNAVFSPYGASAVLTMLDVGAAGETDAQLRTVLGLPDNGAKLAPAFSSVACRDVTDGSSNGNQLSMANALWAQSGDAFEAQFLSVLSDGYAAPLEQVDFKDPDASTATINAWVSEETGAQIPAVLQPADVAGGTALVVVNATYFNGIWDVGFDPKNTFPQLFTLADGDMIMPPTMSGNVEMGIGGVALGDQTLAVYELPYKGRAMAMDFLVPSMTLTDAEANLTPAALEAALKSLQAPTEVALLLPKFSFNTQIDLKSVLFSMGVTDFFDKTKADLSGIDGKKDLYATVVVQDALVEVNEHGTVAAAATAAGVGGLAIEEPTPVAIDVPFLFLIRDTRNGSILFMGRVGDPLAD